MRGDFQCAWVIGAGFLGAELARLCSQQGTSVLSVDPVAPAQVKGYAHERKTLDAALHMLEPHVVFCCASTHGGSVAAYRDTYLQTVEQLKASVPQARLVFCSSTALYEGRAGELVDEETPCPCSSEKARILLRAEAAVQGGGGVVARLASLYGVGRCELIRRHMVGEPQLPGSAQRWLNYVHVQDAARALLLLGGLSSLPHSVYNVCGESFSKEIAYRVLEQASGRKAAPDSTPAGVRRGVSNHCVSSERLRALGWRPQVTFGQFAAAYCHA